MSAQDPSEGQSHDPNPGKADVNSLRIAEYLRTAILQGEFEPGARIRQEEIAERLGSSRIPVREALRIVEAEGLVTLKAYSGARVAKLDYAEFVIAYRIRERLDPLALSESIKNLTDEDINELGELQIAVEAADSPDRFVLADRDFHLATYRGCSDHHLLSTITRFWNTTQHYRRAFAQLVADEGRDIVNYEHRLLIDAVTRRDEVDGERFLSGHIRRTRLKLAVHPEIFDKY